MSARGRAEILADLTGPGARFEIHHEDVRGNSLQVFKNRHRTLPELLTGSLALGDGDYLVTDDSRMSYTEHYQAVASLAAALRDEHGVAKGDRVALCGANSMEWIVAFWATVSLGAIAVGLNSMWADREIADGIELTEPKLVFADAPRAAQIGEPGVPVLSFEADLHELISRHRGADLVECEIVEDDPAVILFTSGTTGRAKGATHSHRNVISCVWFHLLSEAIATEMGHPPGRRRYLLVSPLFHVSSLHNLAVVRLVTGDAAVIHRGRFDIERILSLMEQERVTNWGAVPTMLSRLVEADLDKYDLSALRTLTINSAPSSPWLKERIREVLPVAGRSLGTSYGMTESSTAATIATAAELEIDPDSVGSAIPTMEVEVRDARGEPVPDGVEGEIYLRGPLMMLGYWRNPEATDESTAAGGWFRTGDLGTMQKGTLRVSSRRSDLILRGGENVYPAEVEHQLVLHPEVAECMVAGVDDPDLGQAVAAVVVRRPDSAVSEEELRDYLAARLARYKVPTRWVITEHNLPRNATGKVIRKQVDLT